MPFDYSNSKKPSGTDRAALYQALKKRLPGLFNDMTEWLLHIEYSSGSEMLESTQAFLSAFCEGNFRPNVAQRLANAGYELLENGLQYGGIREKVVIQMMRSTSMIGVCVVNEAISARSSILTQHLARIEADPEGVYLEEFRRSLGPTQSTRSMLGLARVAHEAKLRLLSEVRGQQVAVIAVSAG